MADWIVTGASGFLGRHLLDTLAREAPDVRALALGRRPLEGWPADRFLAADLDDPASLARTLAPLAPAVVVHLAGRTPPADPRALYRANTRATANLLDALRHLARPVRVVLAGSAAELGSVPMEALPVGEDARCRPADAYGLSKWFAAAYGRAQPPPLEVVSARIFNPIGPGLPPTQAFGRFARLLAEAAPGPLRLTVGDLDSRRDFIDARDVASALIALARSGQAGSTYHVGTGRSHRVGEGLERLISLSGRDVQVVIDPDLPRRGPIDSRADVRRLVNATGWSPRISWEQSLTDLWAAARSAAARARRVA